MGWISQVPRVKDRPRKLKKGSNQEKQSEEKSGNPRRKNPWIRGSRAHTCCEVMLADYNEPFLLQLRVPFSSVPGPSSYVLSLPLQELCENFSIWKPCPCSNWCIPKGLSVTPGPKYCMSVSQPATYLMTSKISWTSNVSLPSFFQQWMRHFRFSTFTGEKPHLVVLPEMKGLMLLSFARENQGE